MDEAKTLAVNIVTWNSLGFLPNLFASLDEQGHRDFTVTVVDNASDDGTLKWLQTERTETGTLRNIKNQGFARAHNQAIALALQRWPKEDWGRRYILVLNPDVELAPECLRQLVAAMEADLELSAVGPKLLRAISHRNEDGEREVERTDIIDAMGIQMTKRRQIMDRGAGEKDAGQYDNLRDVFGLSGAFVLFRASALVEAANGQEWFDEDFFCYKEDVDLAWRMKRMGLRAQCIPEAVAWHHRRVPTPKDQGFLWLGALMRRFKKDPRVNLWSTRNHYWMIWKNDELGNRLAHLPWILPYELGKLLVAPLSASSMKGIGQALAGLGKMRAKRRAFASKVKVTGAKIRLWFV